MDRQRANPSAEPELTVTSRTAPRTSGTATGVPRRWLRLEAAVLLGGSLVAYSATGQPWWLVAGAVQVLALGLVWLAHIGADQLLGYGLKYDDNFQHTHLGQLGRPKADHDNPDGIPEAHRPSVWREEYRDDRDRADPPGFCGEHRPGADPS